jgi:quercetin dioxygenase-like cupin family protein
MEAANLQRAPSQPAANLLPPEILALPKIEIPVSGADGYCLHDDEKQVVFFVFEEGVSFPDHSHCSQRGLVISGEMIIEIDGESNLYQAGDSYLVPENVLHRAVFSKQTVLIDMSDAPDRYRTA